MKRWLNALIAVTMVLSLGTALAAPAFAHDSESAASDWRHHSPFTSSLLYPIALTAFFADVPIWMLSREQPFTYGLTEMEMTDGYNPVTDQWTHNAVNPHDMDVTADY